MRRRFMLAALVAGALGGALGGEAGADPALRAQVYQQGDFLLIGNTLGHDCSTSTPAPLVGTVGPCPGGTTGSAGLGPDVFWRADSPMPGMATASMAFTAAQARSTAVLNLPVGATVTHAYLYWGGRPSLNGGMASSPDPGVVLDRQGGFMANVMAIQSWSTPGTTLPAPFGSAYPGYQSVADVTAIVQQNGPGPYRVGGVDSMNFSSAAPSNNTAVGWWMVVFYAAPTLQIRQLSLFDGLDFFSSSVDVSISGLVVPAAGYTAHLGIVTYGGAAAVTGDTITMNGAALSDALNPANNFFNGTRSYLGSPVSIVGDLPQLSGNPGSMSEMDIDVVDVTPNVAPGDTVATVGITGSSDAFFVGGMVTSISTFAPSFGSSSFGVYNLTSGNLGSTTVGDLLEYTIGVLNTGSDTAVDTVLEETLPSGLNYVSGSLQVITGANVGVKTDGAGDDQGEYDGATRTVRVRLGAGASGSVGGALLVNGQSTIEFIAQVVPVPGCAASIRPQVRAAGLQGVPVITTTIKIGPTVVIGCPQTQCGTTSLCDTTTGLCGLIPVPAPDGSPCDDGDPCSQGDTCLAGACQAGPSAQPDGTACDDSDLCTSDEACQSGKCTPLSVVQCSTSVPCRASTCDPSTGLCGESPEPDGSPCDDGKSCTKGDTCQNGSCKVPGPEQKPDGSSCDDGDPCTQPDACFQGTCKAGDQVECLGDACHGPGTCNPMTGACDGSMPLGMGTGCDDGNPCTDQDACDGAGHCRGAPSSSAKQCGGEGFCANAGTCDGKGKCSGWLTAGMTCSDQKQCVMGGSCDGAGKCTGGSPPECPQPSDACHDIAQCVVGAGCIPPPKDDGAPCQSHDKCTQEGTCAGGACQSGPPRSCPDNYQCDPGDGHCRTSCATSDHCAAGFVCDRSQQCVDPPPVASGEERSCAVSPAGEAGGAPWRSAALSLLALAALALRRRAGRSPLTLPGARRPHR